MRGIISRMKKHDPKYLVDLLKKNVDNEKLTDEAFREFVRTSLELYRSSEDDEKDFRDSVGGQRYG